MALKQLVNWNIKNKAKFKEKSFKKKSPAKNIGQI